jgi:hypothetical protein
MLTGSAPDRFVVAATVFLSDLGCFGFLTSRLDLFCPFDTALSLEPVCEFAFVNHPLLTVRVIFNAILRRVAFHRKQTNDSVAAFASVIDASPGKEVHRLTHTEFVLHHLKISNSDLVKPRSLYDIPNKNKG